MDEIDHRRAVERDHLRVAPGRLLDESARRAETGVVDEQVHLELEAGHFLCQRRATARQAEIGGDHRHLPSGRGADLLGECKELVLAASDEDQVVPAFGEHLGKHGADAGGGAGDEGGGHGVS